MPEENTTNSNTNIGSPLKTNITASDTMVAALSEKRNNLISASYENPGEEKITRSSAKAIVDILNNYAWANETAKSSSDLSFNLKTNIPYCLLIEREQTVTSSIMNIVRDVGVVGQGLNKTLSALKFIPGVEKISDGIKKAGTEFEGLISDNSQNIVASLAYNLDQSILQNARINGAESGESILSPYNYLYATEMTGFRYVFPMLNGQDLYALTNQWTDEQSTYTSLLLDPNKNPILSFIKSTATVAASTVGSDIPNLLNIFKNGANANKNAVYEMAKYFNFSEEGDEVKIDFALFNTVVKNGIIDQWKRNLYFISLFNMRNLPFKLDYTTFLPPLLYDVIIPGVKRLPFAYVSSFTAEPQGLIRNMPVDNFLSKIAGINTSANNKVSVPIPEAWVISITFKSMLSRSANLMLAGGADLPISINMNNSQLKEYVNNIDEIDKANKDITAIGESIEAEYDGKTLTFNPTDVMDETNKMQNEQFVSSKYVKTEEQSIFDEEAARTQQLIVDTDNAKNTTSQQSAYRKDPSEYTPPPPTQEMKPGKAADYDKDNYEPLWTRMSMRARQIKNYE